MTAPTMNDIVTRALRRLRAINPREAAEAVTASNALDALNDMMHSWGANGVDTDHTTEAATDDFPLGDEHVQGVAALLAVRIAGDHGMQVDAGIERDASQGWDALQAEFFDQAADGEIDPGLLRLGRLFR